MSPDMSPIENLWDELKRKVYARPHPPVNVQQLEDAVIEAWNAIPQAFIANFVQSMRHRCVALINARVGFARYWHLKVKLRVVTFWLLKVLLTIYCLCQQFVK